MAHINPEIMINGMGFFFKYLKNMTNQRLIFDYVAIFDLLHMINSLDYGFKTHKIGSHNKNR